MNLSLIDEVVDQLKVMPPELQSQVLEFVRNLVKTELRGTPGTELIYLAGSIPTDDLELMRQAIEEDCQKVDFNEW